MSNYEVKWNSYGSNAVAYIDGPGVEALRLDLGDNIDTESIAEALDAAYTAGREAERGDVAHWAQQELTVPTRYARVGRSRSGRPDASEVAAYLPGNYRVVHADSDSIMIAGVDNSGWTLDGYVIPRLGSGLITAEEWTADRMEAFLATAGRSEADKIAEIAAERDDGRF